MPLDDETLCRTSALFDAMWYVAQYPDVAATGMSPLAHYLLFGAAEGRDPMPFFDSDWYLAQHPDVAAVGMNPLVHYLRFGAAEGRDPHPMFDTDWYLAQLPDASCNPLSHYVLRGAAEERAPHPLFTADWSNLPELAQPDIRFLARGNQDSAWLNVSIVVPVFNKLPYLQECLNSVLSQSFSDMEIICVDDASNDGSTNVLLDYAGRDHRISVIRILENSGPAAARNIGIQQSRGQFIQFTDADDVLPRTAIETLYCRIVNDGVELVRGNLCAFERTALGNIPRTSMRSRRSFNFRDERELWIPWWHQCYLFSRRFIIGNNILYPNLTNGEDPVFLARALVKSQRMSCTADITYHYRQRGGYNRTELRYIMDFIRHVANVKQIFLSSAPECWTQGYRAFIARGYHECFVRSASRTNAELAAISLALKRAGLNDVQELRQRLERPVQIVDFGPNPVQSSVPFNVQSNGASALWIRTTSETAKDTRIVLGDAILDPVIDDTLITAVVPSSVTQQSGKLRLLLLAPNGAPRSNQVYFQVMESKQV
jgi:glycosyltransferase involved in cell wall biosynthesis